MSYGCGSTLIKDRLLLRLHYALLCSCRTCQLADGWMDRWTQYLTTCVAVCAVYVTNTWSERYCAVTDVPVNDIIVCLLRHHSIRSMPVHSCHKSAWM